MTLELVAAWLPFIIIIILVFVTGRMSMKSYSSHVARVEAINNDLVVMNREMLAELREIKQLLKDQN